MTVQLYFEMATGLTNKAATDRTLNIFKLSFNFLRNASTSTQTKHNVASSTVAKNPKQKKKKKKNLFEVAQFLPSWGIGYQFAKTHWTNVSYQITKINLYKDGRHGKAWGIVHKDGLPAADAPRKISGVHKRCWRYLPSSLKSESIGPNATKSTADPPNTEILPA